MGHYLTDKQIEKATEELRIVYAMPYATTLVGPAWEQILAELKGGRQTVSGARNTERWLRGNRATPDIVVKDGQEVNYSLKTEALRITKERQHAQNFLGYYEDLTTARPKVGTLLTGRDMSALDASELGALVLRFYNEHIVQKYKWNVISILLRIEHRTPYEFIYWEERPPTLYNPADYWWRDSGKATGGNRNINGYPITVAPDAKPLPRATFKFTSGGKQFYILYKIPDDADIWTVDKATLTMEEVREALRELLRRRQRLDGQEPAT